MGRRPCGQRRVRGPILLPGRRGSATADLNLWDGIVGVKGCVELGGDRKWFVPYDLDVGTGQSSRTWGYLNYQMRSGAPVQSMNFNGPAIATVWRW